MRKLLMLAAAFMAFKGARGAKTAYGARDATRPSIWSLLPILLAPRFLRIPMLLRAMWSRGPKTQPQPVPVRTRRVR